MKSGFQNVSQSQLLERVGTILADCSQTCIRLQDVISPILANECIVAGGAVSQMQDLDKLSQQLEDLSKLMLTCSICSDETPAIYSLTIHAATTLEEIREKIFGAERKLVESGDFDLF